VPRGDEQRAVVLQLPEARAALSYLPDNEVARALYTSLGFVETGEVELMIWSPAAFQAEYKAVEAMAPEQRPAIVGIAIAVERARPLQALLGANNIPFALTEGNRVVVPAESTDGLMIEFMPQN